jgi:DNA-binding CsgD family transcriptional regulator
MDMGSVNDNLEEYHATPPQLPAGSIELIELEDSAQELRANLGADGYAVCRTNRFVDENKDSVSIIFGSIDRNMRSVLSDMSDEVQRHMEESLLPFCWSQPGDATDESSDFVACLPRQLPGPQGVGFPVKLGIMGNGFVVFFGSNLDLSGDRIVEFHRESYRLLRDLLALDVRKAAPQQNLNDRELQCLQLAADGYKSEAIASELVLSVHTVNAYLGFAADKLDAVNRIQAIAKAIRLGLIG